MSKPHTVIIGNGIAGITTARYLRKHASKARITVVSAESEHFFSRTALMYVYMGHMKWSHIKPYEDHFWPRSRIELLMGKVESIDFEKKELKLNSGRDISYDKLVIATGSTPAYYGWPGEQLKGVQGLYSRQDLELLEASTPPPGSDNHPCRQAVIAGGGLIGVELAEMLLTRKVKVTMLVRENHFWGNVITPDESRLIMEHMAAHGVEIKINTQLKEISGDERGRVKSITDQYGNEYPCQLVGITTGVRPNIDFLKGSALEIARGILVNEYLETNMADVYAAGDCAEIKKPRPGRRAIEPVWYTGRMMGEVLGASLAGKRTPYLPGPWFNSAKFFDIEYQTYGEVRPDQSTDHSQFHWKVPNMNIAITLAWNPADMVFSGINAYGVRLRHEYFDLVLRQRLDVGTVVANLKKAHFDAEFYKERISVFQEAFSTATGIAGEKKGFFNMIL